MARLEDKVASITGAARGQARKHALESVRHYNMLNHRTLLPPDEAEHVTGVALPVDAGHMILPGYNPFPTR